jgi:hypothetical protein
VIYELRFMIDDLKTQEKKGTAKYANHAKKEADWGVPFAYLASFTVESLCLISEVTLGRLCPGGEDSCQTKPIPGGWHTPLFQCSIIPPFQSDADRAKQSQLEEV